MEHGRVDLERCGTLSVVQFAPMLVRLGCRREKVQHPHDARRARRVARARPIRSRRSSCARRKRTSRVLRYRRTLTTALGTWKCRPTKLGASEAARHVLGAAERM